MYKIMFSAGETSGDMHGANLAKALKNICSDIEMFGFGGPQMEQAGVKLCKNMLDYSVMGFWEVLVNLRKMFKLKDALVAEMKKQKPDILVLIDYPDFNWRLAKEAKKMNIPVFSYIPPSAWAWRKGRAKEVAKIADKIVAIFPFELDVYKKAGADISFVGNPLMDNVKASMSREMAANNVLQYASVFQTELDKAAVAGATSGWMELNDKLVKYEGGAEVKIPQLDMDGLADYDRQNGFVEGDRKSTRLNSSHQD